MTIARGDIFGDTLRLNGCAVDSDGSETWIYALVDEAEVGAQEVARVVARTVDDQDAAVLFMLANILEGCDNAAFPLVEGTADIALEIDSIFAHNGAKLEWLCQKLFAENQKSGFFGALKRTGGDK